MEDSKINSLARYRLLVNIYVSYKKNQEFTISELAKQIGVAPSNPIYQDVYNFLINSKCFVSVRIIGRSHLYILKTSVLEGIIRKSYPFILTSSFIKSSTIGYNF